MRNRRRRMAAGRTAVITGDTADNPIHRTKMLLEAPARLDVGTLEEGSRRYWMYETVLSWVDTPGMRESGCRPVTTASSQATP